VEAALIGKADRGAHPAPRQREGLQPLAVDADLAARLIFVAQFGDVALLGWEEVSVDAGEVGIDPLVAADGLDPVDRCDLAVVV
jgi:hypothetical protein